jgi:DNA-binding response OmpR family regulator
MPSVAAIDAPQRVQSDRRPVVLVVEDDSFMADVMTEMLDAGGYAVEHATTAAEARRKIGQSQPVLIVLDLILPDLDGLILCADIRRETTTPIVVVSGTNRKRDAVHSLRLGADDFILKPFDMAEFEERIRTVLRRAA